MVLASRYVGYSRRRTYLLEPKWLKRDTLFLVFSTAFYGGVLVWGLL
jgi:energy-coupling factor transport system permease protein